MELDLQYKPYKRRFSRALKKPGGLWEDREGILVRVQDCEGRRGYGEIAPLEWFRTESIGNAIQLLESFNGKIDPNTTATRWGRYPCATFGMQSAIKDLNFKQERSFKTVRLIKSIAEGFSKLEEGISELKMKLTWDPKEKELEDVKQLSEKGAHLRLDPNGAFTREEFIWWMEGLEDMKGIAFLEQPLAIGREREMVEISKDFKTQVALDESMSSLKDLLKYESMGFCGLYVIKPSTMGDIDKAGGELGNGMLKRLVYSTALETSIGAEACLGAIPGICEHSVGFGASSFFTEDGMNWHSEGKQILYGKMSETEKEEIWKRAHWE